jgi:hypothetical protein
MSFDIEKAVVERIAFFENFSRETVTLDALKKLYAPNVHYHRPFHDVDGIEEILSDYNRMFDQYDEITFKETAHAASGSTAFISWKTFVKAGKKQGEFDSVTRLLFDEKGLVKDAFVIYDTSIFYEAVPILGPLMKWVRKKHLRNRK